MIGTKKFFGQTQKEINGLIHIVHPCVFPSFSYRCKNEVVKQNGEWVEKRPPQWVWDRGAGGRRWQLSCVLQLLRDEPGGAEEAK